MAISFLSNRNYVWPIKLIQFGQRVSARFWKFVRGESTTPQVLRNTRRTHTHLFGCTAMGALSLSNETVHRGGSEHVLPSIKVFSSRKWFVVVVRCRCGFDLLMISLLTKTRFCVFRGAAVSERALWATLIRYMHGSIWLGGCQSMRSYRFITITMHMDGLALILSLFAHKMAHVHLLDLLSQLWLRAPHISREDFARTRFTPVFV